ncbi:EAL domain-containing protein [Planomicrobium okeanokoites]|uniref:EAL domain-containing protein n=1 Tax=Planomicrobium okeanokoites TaxID=244 RepID=UPI000A04DB74|nr:EAL domain-containing protein [Planomicrobium okeanokoites]
MGQRQEEELHLPYNLVKQSISNRQYKFMYQPILNVKTGGVGLEMLARWQHEGEWISPLQFIPAIEEQGLITDFNKLLVDQLIADHQMLKETLKNFSFISLNLSPYIFINKEEVKFMEYLTERLRENNIMASEVCLEITESSMLNVHSFSFLEESRKEGFLIAIDDFGTGFSSLEYLIGNSFNVLKLDIALIRQITTKPRKIAIVDSVLMLSKKLKYRVIAEGVETKEQYDLLNKLGIDYIQGYYISKPLFIEDLFRQFNLGN